MINKQIGIKIMTNDFPVLIKYAQLEGKKSNRQLYVINPVKS